MILHIESSDATIRQLVRHHKISLAGNIRLRIYGLLGCSSGKRMKRKNRIFFESSQEARQLGYRPCGHCLRKEYATWKMLHAARLKT